MGNREDILREWFWAWVSKEKPDAITLQYEKKILEKIIKKLRE